ncbi:MAG: hypothetical protein QOG15_3352 [Solirubrobacteraceae bacterium]|jgi:hypothetical protein|nr:hypothetical protein [Solirubrobacteraceae bacterium]
MTLTRGWFEVLVATAGLAAVVASGCGGSGKKSSGKSTAAHAQTVRFQMPEEPGPNPFTTPVAKKGPKRVALPVSGNGSSQQPFGGSGSNSVCDRDKLLRFLHDNPEVMRVWAGALGAKPSYAYVKRYIAKLHPVTLTRDTQVTNHALKNGVAVPFQAILQAGTAVLVDKYGVPVVRCFCGNPLKPAVFVSQAKCLSCPPHYTPPRQCTYRRSTDYNQTYYRRTFYSNGDYDELFIRRQRFSPYSSCYTAYPDPPQVTIVNIYRAPPTPPPPPLPPPPVAPPPPPPPSSGLQCNPPRSQLESEQCAAQNNTMPQDQNQAPPPPPPPPNSYDCPALPPAHPGPDYLANCG